MQKLKRLDDLLEHDADKIDEERQPSDFQLQIDSTNEEIRRAFEGDHGLKRQVRAKLTNNPIVN